MPNTVPLPPWARKIQQTWLWQVFFLPIIVGFVGSFVTNGGLAHGIFAIDQASLESALNYSIVGFVMSLVSGHSPGSASFHRDGTPNLVVQHVQLSESAE